MSERMTPADILALGRRAVACPRWRWLPGMRYLLREYVENSEERCADWTGTWGERVDEFGPPPRTRVFSSRSPTVGDVEVIGPDLRDPATVGAVLALVREAWGPEVYVEAAYTSPGAMEWFCRRGGYDTLYTRADSEPAALISALEAAP